MGCRIGDPLCVWWWNPTVRSPSCRVLAKCCESGESYGRRSGRTCEYRPVANASKAPGQSLRPRVMRAHAPPTPPKPARKFCSTLLLTGRPRTWRGCSSDPEHAGRPRACRADRGHGKAPGDADDDGVHAQASVRMRVAASKPDTARTPSQRPAPPYENHICSPSVERRVMPSVLNGLAASAVRLEEPACRRRA